MNRIGILLAGLFGTVAFAQPTIITPQYLHPTSFAIIVDSVTYAHVGNAVQAYRDAVEQEGLSTYIVIDRCAKPEDVRRVIRTLWQQKPRLEGIVLVGDIPIPMIRDAQHLTSAFKMDQERFSWEDSSVPSDRYYDDFDLKFEFQKKDSANPLLFYYTLTPDSPQRIERDIYSGRIMPQPETGSRHELIGRYLHRLAKEKDRNNRLDHALFITGHGYNSESLSSWENEYLSIREQLPQLFQADSRITDLYHAMTPALKDIALHSLQQPDLDLAVFHAHGSDTEQYLSGYPQGESIQGNVEAVKRFVRSKLRQANRRNKSLEETKRHYKQNYGIPSEWFESTFDDSVILQDSLLSASLNIHVDDIQTISPQADIVIFDQCFNGAFINTPYVAGEYLFGNGTVIVGIANSVNVKQDIWASEFIGLLQHGVRIGLWHQNRNMLETHLFGDPTYHFRDDEYERLNRLMVLDVHSISKWKRMAKSDQPILRALALSILFQNRGPEMETELIRLYRTDPAFTPRMQALKCLAQLRTQSFEDLLKESISDPYEFIRRISAVWMGEVGREEYLPYLAERIMTDASERVGFQSRQAMEVINPSRASEVMIQYLEKSRASMFESFKDKGRISSFEHAAEWVYDDLIPRMQDKERPFRARNSAIRTFRSYKYHMAVPALLERVQDPTEDVEIRVSAMEALGWFTFSYRRPEIMEVCQKLSSGGQYDVPVRDEALKTFQRLQDGPNDPITP